LPSGTSSTGRSFTTRSIEQYGPRLTKPYAFYDWVVPAKAEISRRGETPVPLVIEPYGSALAGRARDVVAEASVPREPDPQGKIQRDVERLIEAEVVVVPARVRPGQAARIHVTFRPGAAHNARWNNESAPLRVWVDGPPGWTVASRLSEAPQGDQPESVEVRRLDFEVKAPSTSNGRVRLTAYALYSTCEQARGGCLFLRYREKSGTSAHPDPDLTEATFDAPQSTRAISRPKARARSQQSGRLRVADTAPLSLTFPGRSCESSAASVPESRPRRISLARG
jgi:hypothetical protein